MNNNNKRHQQAKVILTYPKKGTKVLELDGKFHVDKIDGDGHTLRRAKDLAKWVDDFDIVLADF